MTSVTCPRGAGACSRRCGRPRVEDPKPMGGSDTTTTRTSAIGASTGVWLLAEDGGTAGSPAVRASGRCQLPWVASPRGGPALLVESLLDLRIGRAHAAGARRVPPAHALVDPRVRGIVGLAVLAMRMAPSFRFFSSHLVSFGCSLLSGEPQRRKQVYIKATREKRVEKPGWASWSNPRGGQVGPTRAWTSWMTPRQGLLWRARTRRWSLIGFLAGPGQPGELRRKHREADASQPPPSTRTGPRTAP